MSERNDRDERSAERRGAEGVRIIGPEEAQAALEAGAAAGRRPDDELRFGDVPPAPSGPRPPHRFPLPDSVDPAEAVPRPPVVAPPRVDPMVHRARPTHDDVGDPRPWHERTAAPAGAPDPGADTVVDLRIDGVAHPSADPTATSATATPTTHIPTAIPGRSATSPADLGVSGLDPTPPRVAPAAVDDTVDDLPAQQPHWSAQPGPGVPGDPSGPVEAVRPADVGRSADHAHLADRSHPADYGHPTDLAHPAELAGPAEVPTSGAAPHPTHLAGSPVYDADPVAPVGVATPEVAADPIATVSVHPVWPVARQEPDDAPAPAPPDEGITVSGGYETELPHWADPPTGEVPRILADRGGDEDLAAWEALGSRSTTWRDNSSGWDQPDDLDDLEGARMGALDESRTEHSDLYSFDEDFERLEEERSGQYRAVAAERPDPLTEEPELYDDEPPPRVTRVSTRQASESRPARMARGARTFRPGGAGGGGGAGAQPGADEIGSRLIVGVGLVVLLIVAYAVGPLALLVLATAVVTAAAAEVYDMLRPSGFRPATLLGLVATVGVMFAAYWRGAAALPLVVVLVFVASMLWYLLGVVEARPLANVAVTVSAFVWVGVLGSYAALLLRSHHGRGLFLGAVLPAVAADIAAYFSGRRLGSRMLAPTISPGKTWEGAVGGGVAAVVVGIIVGHSISPWGGVSHGFVLGLAVAVLAPVGDLFESMVKRDLSVKDSGSMLSGHGGVLDRFDAVLLVLPAAYYLASLWGTVR